MSSRLRLPLLALAALSIGLNIAILGCAGRTLHVYNSERHTSPYFLPIWSSHFDTRELSALIATSILTFLLNCIIVLSLFVTFLPANLLILASTTLSTILSLIALIFSAVLNSHAPSPRDTLQSWTCRWRTLQNQDDSIPRSYDTLCHETRFAFYTTIPVLILQLLLLGLAVSTLIAGKKQQPRGVRLDEEKDFHELASRGLRPQQSFDAKTEGSLPESMRVVAGKQ